ncbi:MAG TPA: hypothetical protein VFK11_01810 [Candidatus Saccharimonadales bacterium]|nr:hypothetical protein [Candidatus Saccharimonadales bacterium]
MDFTKEGLIRIEDKPGEGEVLGQAVALGQSFFDVLRESGVRMTMDHMGAVLVSTVLNPAASPEFSRQVMGKFKRAEIDSSPRVLQPKEGSALYQGLALMGISNADARTKRIFIGAGGHNARNAFLNRNNVKRAKEYKRQLKRAMEESIVKDFPGDDF